MTNADKLRSLNDEELAEFLDKTQEEEFNAIKNGDENIFVGFDSCKRGWLLWLNKEYKDDDE